MQRITDATAAAMLPAPPSLAGLTPGYFTGGVAGGVAATRVRYWWLNMIQEEGMSILAAAGITPDTTGTVFDNILQAIQVLINAAGGQVFTASGTFTVPAGITSVEVEVWGGSGGSGGAGSTGGGAGGGGGGYARKLITGLTPGATIAITIGAGGTAGASGGGNGGNGGTSSFGTYVSATGGNGGWGSSGTVVLVPGGSGVGGDENIAGGYAGGPGSNGMSSVESGGQGGAAPRGGLGGLLAWGVPNPGTAPGGAPGGGGSLSGPPNAGLEGTIGQCNVRW